MRTFRAQYGKIELRKAPHGEIHDRHIIVDRLAAFYLGHSIKDPGKKNSETKPHDMAAGVQTFVDLWQRSTPVV
jgi:hypothetical protein